MWSSVMGRSRLRPLWFRKQASAESAFTSHGWPWNCPQTRSAASGRNAYQVSSVDCARRDSTSSREKPPRRSERALILNALPPETTVFSALDRMR